MIGFQQVTKTYDDGTIAVDTLNLDAPAGKITVLVGPSGCGKTTTLRMVNRMIAPTSGRILLDGIDTASMRPAQLRRGIGYVIQHAGLFPHRTVVANVMTVPKLLGWDSNRARSRALEVLELVGLDPAFADRYPNQLSGGQQQRVGVARALAADPQVMLMDEPFSAVDPVVRSSLQDSFLRLQAELGTTILMVTHDIDEAIKLGDRVAVMNVGGQLAQIDSPQVLLADPANDFVADFLGRDRGYRALGFHTASVPVHPQHTISLGEAAPAGWSVVLDEQGAPLGWVEGSQVHDRVRADDLHRGGTLAPRTGSLRVLLDAALSSPSRRGVVVDGQGRFAGVVHAAQVLATIEGRRAGDAEEQPLRPV
ncbi:MAG: ABC transporter ATP-binding protein [Beutenbergiaceae bacterium]